MINSEKHHFEPLTRQHVGLRTPFALPGESQDWGVLQQASFRCGGAPHTESLRHP